MTTPPNVQLRYEVQQYFKVSQACGVLEQTTAVRIEIAVEPVEILNWFRIQRITAKFYWADRITSCETAGVGTADVLTGDDITDCAPIFRRIVHLTDRRIRYYGGVRFGKMESHDETWESVDAVRFVLPRFELYSANGATMFACNFIWHPCDDTDALCQQLCSELDGIIFQAEDDPTSLPSAIDRTDAPNREEWCGNIDIAKDILKSTELDKIVLARKTTLTCSGPLNPGDVLIRLRASVRNCFLFCFQFGSEHAFVGASPELLYSRDSNNIYCEAIAGTRHRGASAEDDITLGNELLNSDKDRYEHRLVMDDIEDALRLLCSTYKADPEVTLLKLPRLQHLYAKYEGLLNDNVSDAFILECLHPTPAVGSSPKREYERLHDYLEPFDRGWYAGPIGWIGSEGAIFAVGIRSALVKDRQISLFSGAGIVSDSDAHHEWEEIEHKICHFRDIILGS